MIERITDHNGYLIRFRSRKPTDKAILLLHGFPANRNVKNLDIAYWLHDSMDAHLYVLHYRGLGESPGDFRFTYSIEEAISVTHRITDVEQQKLHAVVGHSWGGLVAMNVARERGRDLRTLILASPLSHLSKTEGLYQWIIRDVRKDCPGVYGVLTEAEVIADLEVVAEKYSPQNAVAGIAPETTVHIIQAAQDDTTPADRTKALIEHFSVKPTYEELPMDHSFSQSRKGFADAILRKLQT